VTVSQARSSWADEGSIWKIPSDGLPDAWEVACFGDLNQAATGDCDSDGQNNLLEYMAGANPTDPAPAVCDALAPMQAGTQVKRVVDGQ
jgi:hypothetical protein